MIQVFSPRLITADQAAQGYNNEGRGQLIGYLADPVGHHETCRYRVSTGGDPNKKPHETCNCRLGLWKDVPPAKPAAAGKRKKARPPRKAKSPKRRTTKKAVARKSKKSKRR